MSHILIVEDEQHLADGLRFNLEAEGHQVDVSADGEQALKMLVSPDSRFEVVVLDVMLPGKNGFEVAAELRRKGQFVPILMLTARSRPEDVLQGFESGADDYLAKPFELKILIARINGLLRRRHWLQQRSTPPAEQENSFAWDGNRIDFSNLELHAGEKTYQLTTMECDLLRFLVEHSGKPVSRKAILENVWGLHEDTDTRAIDNFIVRLRRYLEPDPSRPKYLLTVRGVGYKFDSKK